MAATSSLVGVEGTSIDKELSPLQKHVSFFDRNKDGIVYPSETYKGFREIGCGVALSAFSAIFINVFLSGRTAPAGKASFPYFPIYVDNIHKGKHGSDSGVYDSEGRFVSSKFEDIFSKHAHTHPDCLTSKELMEMLKANRVPKDYKGWVASWTEWKILYYLCKDKDGLLHKETIRDAFDGSLFMRMEEKRSGKKMK
ncbi:putative peroxygenase 4 [Acorus gramineus]|uniref:Peroxygenase 4 n=1 Tax=Acorus gramineus TaxID=55184 RepID=A0AAV9BFZ8_ACOGR|nr:putative peroxygenase 4 [Acorus gramineus]